MSSGDQASEAPRIPRGLSPRAYAERRGVSRVAVNHAIASGRLSRASAYFDGRRWHIDPEKADEEWERNTRRRRGVNATPEEEAAVAALECPGLPFDPPPGDEPDAGSARAPDAPEAPEKLAREAPALEAPREAPPATALRFGPGDVPVDEHGHAIPPVLLAAIKTGIEARMRQLELEERRGQLVPIAEAAKVWAHVAQTLRDAILAVPARLAQELAAEADPVQVEILLERELTRTLNVLAEKELAA